MALLTATVQQQDFRTGTLRIDEFDIQSESYTGGRFVCPLDARRARTGATWVAVDDRRFIVLERNGGTATSNGPAPFKKVYLIDLEDVGENGVARQTELVDLVKLADPHDLNDDGATTFTVPT